MTTEQYLMGRRALVTGGASGIGFAIAGDLAGRGVEVVISDLPGERLDSAARELEATAAIGADLVNRDDVHRLAGEAGAIDILINCAGVQHVSPVESFDESQWDRLLTVMLTAPVLLIRALIPGMYERGWGRIVNVSSIHGVVASQHKSAYVAAKHGLLGLTKTVALEAAARAPEVAVSAVCPSYVRTPLIENQIHNQSRVYGVPVEDVVERVFLERNALKRLIEPREVAEAVAFLCGESAPTMTGSALMLDAGRLAY
ncbi:MAG: 3-hydroxybutyrate dehydrogenase [Chloroflexota bacterium]